VFASLAIVSRAVGSFSLQLCDYPFHKEQKHRLKRIQSSTHVLRWVPFGAVKTLPFLDQGDSCGRQVPVRYIILHQTSLGQLETISPCIILSLLSDPELGTAVEQHRHVLLRQGDGGKTEMVDQSRTTARARQLLFL